jgi:hypothetical protein
MSTLASSNGIDHGLRLEAPGTVRGKAQQLGTQLYHHFSTKRNSRKIQAVSFEHMNKVLFKDSFASSRPPPKDE